MESLGVPLYVFMRDVGPPFVVVLAGLCVVAWRRPPRRGLLVGALALYLLSAALPYLWLLVQVTLGWGTQTWAALVMTFLQPGLAAASWFLLFAVIVLALPFRPGTGGSSLPAHRRSGSDRRDHS